MKKNQPNSTVSPHLFSNIRSNMKRKALATSVILSASILISTGCTPDRPAAPHSAFHLLDGSVLSTDELQGKVWLLHFWATSCVSCVAEMPELTRLYEEYRHQNVEIVAITMAYDNPKYVKRFQQRENLPFKTGIDQNGKNAEQWGNVSITPSTFLVDASGYIVQTTVGPIDFKTMRTMLNKILPSTNHQIPHHITMS